MTARLWTSVHFSPKNPCFVQHPQSRDFFLSLVFVRVWAFDDICLSRIPDNLSKQWKSIYLFRLLGPPQSPWAVKTAPSSADASMLFFLHPVQWTLYTLLHCLPCQHDLSCFLILFILCFLPDRQLRASHIQVLQFRYPLWLILIEGLLCRRQPFLQLFDVSDKMHYSCFGTGI